jgi:hypothetical protein
MYLLYKKLKHAIGVKTSCKLYGDIHSTAVSSSIAYKRLGGRNCSYDCLCSLLVKELKMKDCCTVYSMLFMPEMTCQKGLD